MKRKEFCEEYEPKRAAGVPPISRAELQARLKHVAGLCYGLVCDIGDMEIETANLRAKVLRLEAKAQGITTEELKRRRGARIAGEQVQISPPLTSEEVKERLKSIAGECYAMNADIKEERDEAATLMERITELEAEIAERKRVCPKSCYETRKRAYKENGGKVRKLTPLKARERAKEYYKRKKQQNASKAGQDTEKDGKNK